MQYEAIVIEGPSRVALATRSIEECAPGHALIKVLATGICGTDLEIFDGSMPYYTMGLANYPIVPGHEWVGEVVDLAGDVMEFKPGDLVVGECSVGCMHCRDCLAGNYHQCRNRTETGVMNRDGGFAQFLHFPAFYLHKLSRRVTIEAAALIEPAAIAYNAVKKAQVTPRDSVAIFGDGPIGLLLLQMSKAFGARSVTVVGATPARLKHAVELGADHALDSTEGDIAARLRDANGGEPPAVFLDATGNPKAVQQLLASIGPLARIVLQGLFAGRSADICLDPLVVNDATVVGALGSPSNWPDVIRLVESGRINPAAIVNRQFTLREFEAGLDCVRRREATKVLVRVA